MLPNAEMREFERGFFGYASATSYTFIWQSSCKTMVKVKSSVVSKHMTSRIGTSFFSKAPCCFGTGSANPVSLFIVDYFVGVISIMKNSPTSCLSCTKENTRSRLCTFTFFLCCATWGCASAA